jgi:hypothetical protein
MHLDGRFAGGMDMRIANKGEKDLAVRFLRIVKPRAPAPR